MPSLYARSVEACRGIDPNKVRDKEEVVTLVKKSEGYKVIKKNWGEIEEVRPSGCSNDSGQVKVLGRKIKIGKKECYLGDHYYDFNLDGHKATFSSVPLSKGKLPLKELSESYIGKLLKIALLKNGVKSFYEEGNLCQVSFSSSNREKRFTLTLRKAPKKWCFLSLSYTPGDITLIPRLYAKDSQCKFEDTP